MFFITCAEVLSGALNALFKDSRYKGYGLPKWSKEINHLAYIDTIIFISTNKYSLEKMMLALKTSTGFKTINQWS